jgi:hypothetical protein
MKTLYPDIADIHRGALSNGFQSLKDLDAVCAITVDRRGQNFLC